jgi:hypothetical protein
LASWLLASLPAGKADWIHMSEIIIEGYRSAEEKVRLHWAEFFWTETGRRLFNVAINGKIMLEHFDIAAAGGDHRGVVREFFVPANTQGNMHLHFTPVRDNTKISGIEILDTFSRP